ncbi:hypothetical protein [Corynebacterium sp. AOP12-C2-36]|uniref:hypothetical protein n=1 Tax=Corynebacterium sp. AOP12-C2-36 TaxID=3457723 RepID=UPI0040340DFA
MDTITAHHGCAGAAASACTPTSAAVTADIGARVDAAPADPRMLEHLTDQLAGTESPSLDTEENAAGEVAQARVTAAIRSMTSHQIELAEAEGTAPVTGTTTDTAAGWVAGDQVHLWITGGCLAMVTAPNGDIEVIGCEESPYGIDAEQVYAQLIERGEEPGPAALGAHTARERDLATTNTPVGRARVCDYADAGTVAAGGRWVTRPVFQVARVTLLTAGAAQLLAAAGYVVAESVAAFVNDASGFNARLTELWQWLEQVQRGDPTRVRIVRAADVTEAAVAVLPLR